MRMTAKMAAMCAFVGLSAWGCGAKTPDTSSVKHDADTPTRGSEAFMWTTVTPTQFKQSLAELLGMAGAEYLAADDTITKRAQFWVDRFDAQLRVNHASEMTNVPKPTAIIVKESSANAFVAPVPVCYTLTVKVRSGTPTPSTTADTVYLDQSSGELSSWPDGITCYDGEADVATIKTVVAKFNAAHMDCQYSVSNQGVLTPGDNCSVAADLDGIVSGKHVAILQTANFITVHTGLLPIMSESQLAGVLAHELGHYYRSHVTATNNDYGYFYTAQENQPAGKPVADPSKKDLGEAAVMSSTLLNAADMYTSYSNANFRSELFFAAGTLVIKTCAAGSCPSACSEAKSLIKSASFKSDMGVFPFGDKSDAQEAAYRSFETKVGACLAALNVSSTAGTLNATSVSWDKIKEAVTAPTWPDWLGQLPSDTRSTLMGFGQLTASRLGDTASATTNLKAAFKKSSQDLNDQETDGVNVLKQAVAEHVGQYTIEQEADDEGAEWISKTGLNPSIMVDAMHSLGQGSVTSMRGMDLGEADCDALWHNGWLDQNGNYVFVPIGDYSEVHHGICYRMFNLEREIKTHHETAADVDVQLLSDTEWRAMQDRAGSLTESTDHGGVFNLAPIAKKINTLSCPYAAALR